MDRIAELRALLADGTITREQLTELRQLIRDEAEGLAQAIGNPAEAWPDATAQERAANVAAAVQSISELRDLSTAVGEAIEQADAAAAEQAQAVADALAAIRAADDTDAAGDTPADGDGEGDQPATTVATTDDGGSDADAPAADDDRVLVTASGTQPRTVPPAPRRVPQVSRVAARAPEMPRPEPMVAKPKMSLVAAANAGSTVNAGDSLDDPERFAEAFVSAIRAGAGHRGPVTRVPVAVSRVEYPDDRKLDGDLRGNLAKINAVAGREAIVASGGACAPTTVLYDLPHLGVATRPVRDQMLVRFGADRGGVRVMAPPKLTDLDAAINIWTAETDAAPGQSTKPCLTVTCPSPTEELVDAIVRCLRFGNFQARFFAEQTQAWMDLAAVRWAREAETKALAYMGANSTNVNVGQGLGTVRDVLAALDRATAAIRNRHRLPDNFPLRFGFPSWLLSNMRTDLAREIPGSAQERLAAADAELMGFFRARFVNPTPFLDGETSTQMFGPQGTGPLLGWPTTVITYLYPEGSWLFLDGGQLDLGVVRDSTLNSTNDFQMFAESFEGVVFHGVESYRLTIDICPSGKTSAATSFDPCAFGS